MITAVTDIAYRRLGSSGLAVSTIGIGCNNFGRRIDDKRADDVVNTALDLGINLFDTADIYGDQAHNSEAVLGAALAKRRDDAVIATKFGGDVQGTNGRDLGARGARRYIRTAVETSLRRLGTDRIDLYQLHFPDAETPVEETMAALDDLVRAGKVLYIGHSNFAGHQIADAAWVARTANLTPFVSAQNRYSLIHRDVENDVLPACEKFGLGLLPYFPLESGLLTGKYKRGEQAPAGTRLAGDAFSRRLAEAPWDTIERFEQYAADQGVTPLDVAIGGLLAQPAVASVIAGATTGEQVRANAAAAVWRPEDPKELIRVLG
jgi:aryl-alcohol dehydrogenase-like predicted oxidoreductase